MATFRETDYIRVIDDAVRDAESLERFVNGEDDQTVITRLSKEYPTLQKAIKNLFENGGLPATPFKTKALMDSSELEDGSYAIVTEDSDSVNGLYVKQDSVWTKSTFNVRPFNESLRDMLGVISSKTTVYNTDTLSLPDTLYNGNTATGYYSGSIQVQPRQIIEITVTLPDPNEMFYGFYLGSRSINVTSGAKNISLPSKKSGTYTFCIKVPNNATEFRFSTKLDDPLNQTLFSLKVHDYSLKSSDYASISWDDFKKTSGNGSYLVQGTTYISGAYRVSAGDVVTLKGAKVDSADLLQVFGSDGTLLDTVRDYYGGSIVLKVPKGADRVVVFCFSENHSSFKASIAEDFELSIKEPSSYAESMRKLRGVEIDEYGSEIYSSENGFDKPPSGAYNSQTYTSTGELKINNNRFIYSRGFVVGVGLNYIIFKNADRQTTRTLRNDASANKGLRVLEALEGEVYIQAFSVTKSHSSYDALHEPLIIMNETEDGLYKSIWDYVGIPFYGFPVVGHASTSVNTYNSSPRIPVKKGAKIYSSVDASTVRGAYWTKDGKGNILHGSDVFTMPDNGFISISTFNSSHASYRESFEPVYDKLPIGGTGVYLPTLELVCVREKVFTDGTDRMAIEYLWKDQANNYYLSKDKRGYKEFIFSAYDVSAELASNPYSMNFDAYGNIVCVFNTASLDFSLHTDSVRRNPIILIRNEGYRAVEVDFGNKLKPSSWFSNCGFIYTDNAIVFAEYTRPSVATANAWIATYPLTDSRNWSSTLSFELSTEVNPPDNMKHFHSVDLDPYTGYIYTTTGDNDAGAAMYVSKDGGKTYSQILSGSQKHCRLLNFVFTKDAIYWASDAYAPMHFFFKVTRGEDGVLDVDNIQELAQFPSSSPATYASIIVKSLNIIVFLNRNDDSQTTTEIDYWDFETNTLKRLDNIPTVEGRALHAGFRCNCFEYVPRGNEIVCGFSTNYLGVCGNIYDPRKMVRNLILSLYRTSEGVFVNYSTVT